MLRIHDRLAEKDTAGLWRFLRRTARRIGITDGILKFARPRYRRLLRLRQTLVGRMMKSGFDRIVQTHLDGSVNWGRYSKYIDLQTHVREAVLRADRLGALERKPMRVVDLGCGTGYLLYVLKEHGHDVLGLDLDDDRLFNRAVEVLGIPRIVHRITPFRRLPDLGEPLDLMTMFANTFDHEGNVWGKEEWGYFVRDCASRLTVGGRLYFELNPARRMAYRYLPGDVAEMLRLYPGANLAPDKHVLQIERMAENGARAT